MSGAGPSAQIDFETVFAGFSSFERTNYQALIEAKQVGNSSEEQRIKQLIAQANIDNFIERYTQFVGFLQKWQEHQEVLQKSIADHDAQIDAHRQDIAFHQNAAAQKVNSYAPGYQAAVDKTVTGRQGANNGGDYAAQPKKKKSGSNCTIV